METNIFKRVAIVLFLAGCFYSCTKRAESDDGGDVPIGFCYSEEKGERGSDTIPVRGEAYFFNDSIPDRIRTKMLQDDKSSFAAWIVYEGDNIATLHVYRRGSLSGNYYHICNFPDFAKQWEAPLTGQKIYYEGKAFYLGGYACATCPTWYDLGLTLLKIK